MGMNVIFDEAAHRYTVDGVELPSVTRLVAPLGDELDESLEVTVEAAAERGTTMHAYLAHRLAGGTPRSFELPDCYRGYADAVELFLDEHTIIPLLIETPLAGDGFAGTPDLVAEYDGVLSVIDYKFVSAVAKSRVGAQLNGYAALCESNGIFPEALLAVQFLPDGDYRIYPVEIDAEPFALCLKLYGYKTKKHPRGRIGGL